MLFCLHVTRCAHRDSRNTTGTDIFLIQWRTASNKQETVDIIL